MLYLIFGKNMTGSWNQPLDTNSMIPSKSGKHLQLHGARMRFIRNSYTFYENFFAE